jgi:hypothetical protein
MGSLAGVLLNEFGVDEPVGYPQSAASYRYYNSALEKSGKNPEMLPVAQTLPNLPF